MNDEIAELADRLRAKLRRGEEPGLEFEIEFASLTDDEPDEFLALFDQRASHGEEKGRRTRRERQDPARASRPTGVQLRAARHVAGAGSPGRLHQRAGGRRGDPRGA